MSSVKDKKPFYTSEDGEDERDFMETIRNSISAEEEAAMERAAAAGIEQPEKSGGGGGSSKKGGDGGESAPPDSIPSYLKGVGSDEQKSLRNAGYFQSDKSKKKPSRLKQAAKKRGAVIAGGVAASIISTAIGIFFSILPFELQHIKNVFETEIGGVRDTVLTTRRGRIYSRSFFFHQESADTQARFDGFRQRGLVSAITGQNIRSTRLLDDMRQRGFDVEPQLDDNGRFTGRLASITVDGETITNAGEFNTRWRNRSDQRAAIRAFFDEAYPEKSQFWRNRKARVVYDRYRLGSLRANWFLDQAVNDADSMRMKIRTALYGETRDVNPARVQATATDDVVDEEGNASTQEREVGGEFQERADNRVDELLSQDTNQRRPLARRVAGNVLDGLASNPGRTISRSISIIGVVQGGCDIKRVLNTVVVASRVLRAEGLTAFAALFMSAADIALTGEADPEDYGNFARILRVVNPDTGNSFFGSGSWQWAADGQGTVDGDIRSNYSIGGGLTGTLGDINNDVDSVVGGAQNVERTCGLANNVIISIGAAALGLVIGFFTGGSSLAGQALAGAALAVALAVVEAIAVPMIIDMVAGTIIHGDEYGDEFAAALLSGYMGYIALQGGNHGFKPVTNRQLSVLNEEKERNIAAAQADMSIMERYFSPNNHRSLTSVASVSVPRSLTNGIQTLASLFQNPFSLIGSPFGALTGNRTYVAAQGEGQCTDEDFVRNDLATDPFCNLVVAQDVNTLAIDPVDNMLWMLDNAVDEDGQPSLSSQHGELYAEYLDRCVGAFATAHRVDTEYSSEFTDFCYRLNGELAHADGSITYLTDEEFQQRQARVYDFDDLEIAYMIQDGTYDEYKDRVAEEMGGKVFAQSTQDGEELSNLTPTMIERFNAFRLDEMLLDSNEEEMNAEFTPQAGEQAAIANIGGEIIGNPLESSVAVDCDPRTDDLGVHDGYVQGELTRMRLCAIDSIAASGTCSECTPGSTFYIDGAERRMIVNSRVSGAWQSLGEAASLDGIDLIGNSGFRSMAHQQALWVQYGMNTSRVASPGNSPHQAGAAIDFAGTNSAGGVFASGATCANRATGDTAVYDWLVANSGAFGFFQYARESWHFDPLTTSLRCQDGGR